MRTARATAAAMLVVVDMVFLRIEITKTDEIF